MTDSSFDNYFKEKLQDHIAPVPSDMWRRVHKRIEKDRRRVLLPRLYYTLLLIGLLAGSGFLYYTQIQSNVTTIVGHKAKEITPQNSQPIPQPNESVTTEKRTTEKKNNKFIGSAENTEVAVTKHKEIKTPDFIEEKLTPKQNGEQELLHYKEKKKSNTDEAISIHSEPLIEKSASQSSSTEEYKAAEFSTPPSAPPAPRMSIPVPVSRKRGIHPISSFSLATTITPYDKHSNNSSLKNLLSKKTFTPIIACPPLNGLRYNSWYVEVYASPDIVTKNISGTPSTYIERKDSTETTQLSYSAGFRISTSLSDRLFLKVGLQYSQINERFQLRTINERKLVTTITTRRIVIAPGDTLLVSDTSTFEQIGFLVKTRQNRYRRIDVPVQLSFEFGNDQLRFALNGGAIFNIYSWNKGEMLDTANSAVSPINIKHTKVYKTNVGISLQGGISIIKPITEYTELFAEPYFRYSLSDMTSNNAGFTQRFNTAGINLGFRYRLR